MRIAAGFITVTLLGIFAPIQAQDQKTPAMAAVYRVEFDVRDANPGATEPRRHYTMVIDETRKGVFQAASRIPFNQGSPEERSVDVGMKLECLVRQSGDKVELEGSIELSKIDGVFNSGSLSEPIIGQARLEFHKSVEPGTAAVIAAAGKYQVEATVTRL